MPGQTVDRTELCGRRTAFLIALVMVSCSPAASGGQPLPSALPASSGTSPRLVDLAAAWPDVPLRSWDSSGWVEVAITQDGGAALGESIAPTEPHARIGPAIMDRATGEVTVIRPFSNPRSQVVSIAGDSNWVAWVEGSLEPSFSDWVLYSYDRKNGQIRTLAAAPKTYPFTPFLAVSMSNGVIVWSAVEAPDGIFHVYTVNADGSGLRILAANAKGPQISWPWVVYDEKPATAGAPATLARENIETGEVRPIEGPADASYFAYDGEAIAWISADSQSLFVQSPLESSPSLIASGQHLQFVSVDQRLVGWGQDKGARAYDRKLKVIIELSDLHGFYPVMSAQALDWLYQPDPNAPNPYDGTVWREVNVGDLP